MYCQICRPTLKCDIKAIYTRLHALWGLRVHAFNVRKSIAEFYTEYLITTILPPKSTIFTQDGQSISLVFLPNYCDGPQRQSVERSCVKNTIALPEETPPPLAA